MLKKVFIISGVLFAFSALYAFNKMATRKEKDVVPVFAEAIKGLFEITVSTSGELLAEKSIEIRGPEISQSGNNSSGSQQRGGEMRAVEMKIQDMVPEGTIVRAGDYVARLDRTSYTNTLNDTYTALKTAQSALEMKIIDTAVVLTSLRDAIRNQTYVVEEAEIELARDKFEPPATIRKAEQTLDKQRRSLTQLKKAYQLRMARNLAEINSQKTAVSNATGLVDNLNIFLSKFTITSPSDGMVIYKKDRLGVKRKTGSSLNAYDLAIAEIPDLNSLVSKTYVNEIEVSRIQAGQKVKINIDAFPEKFYKGTVSKIGNIGEVLPNSDSKMFEVIIKVEGNDPDLRPAMTTSNRIIIAGFDDVVYIPSESVVTGPDGIPYVCTKNGTRQIVILGEANDKNVIVKEGLKEGSLIYLSEPENSEKFRLTGEELISEIK